VDVSGPEEVYNGIPGNIIDPCRHGSLGFIEFVKVLIDFDKDLALQILGILLIGNFGSYISHHLVREFQVDLFLCITAVCHISASFCKGHYSMNRQWFP
jgi:hypothetical protein